MLRVLAGPRAFSHIKAHGLNAADVQSVVCASGAAKTLTTIGLDKVILGQWLKNIDHVVDLLGTSAGAFKLAAACRKDTLEWLDRFADIYCTQTYAERINEPDIRDTISWAPQELIETLIADGGDKEILSHPNFRLHIGTVRSFNQLASENVKRQKQAIARAALLSLQSSHSLRGMAERVVFSDTRSTKALRPIDEYPTHNVALDKKNLGPALNASGAIPVMMHGVEIETEDGIHLYRDGGMLDYHPIPSQLWPSNEGIILYPHFYDYLKWRWFDKFYPWRKVSASKLDNVVIFAPSNDYVKSLPYRRIPSRSDFKRFIKDEPKRIDVWQTAVQRSEELGEAFLELVQSGRIADEMVLLK
ncbi:hypothetical protein IMCC14465_03810 [alpha proteobacterium IMCC14465]|uniref:PNPLA domain-containing protein n=1 Tax=alpha proteobacterium IMCC14465 TaxID=1220535 RepID=J9DY81_9PROT|nr:hypothetical protein IMCC14465_03810 [alpha proteobacterium IMCC14465]